MEKHSTPSRLSVSSWSLHNALGAPQPYGPETAEIPAESHTPDALLKLHAQIAAFGIGTMELCHFHLPSRDDAYLRELRAALEEANVELWSLLVDGGDITHCENSTRDMEWISQWLSVADKLGAKRARVIAGQSAPSPEAFESSNEKLRILASRAESLDLRLMTENWFDLLSKPQHVLSLLGELEGRVGLCLDFGNWNGENKYSNLQEIAPLAESCHAKAQFRGGVLDEADYVQCLEVLRDADFSGPHTLIYSDGGDEWQGLEREKQIVSRYL